MGKVMKMTLICTFLVLWAVGGATAAEQGPMKIEPLDGKFRISVDGQPCAELDYTSYAKPIVYPIYGPGQIPMTRNSKGTLMLNAKLAEKAGIQLPFELIQTAAKVIE